MTKLLYSFSPIEQLSFMPENYSLAPSINSEEKERVREKYVREKQD